MKITRVSAVSGIERTKEFPISQEQWDAWERGAHIQNAMPHLSDEDREFILSGITKEEWDEFGINDFAKQGSEDDSLFWDDEEEEIPF